MSEILKEGPIRRWLKERETLIPRKKIFGGSHGSQEEIKEKIRAHIRPRLQVSYWTKIPIRLGYSYDRGELEIDREKFDVGRVSLTGFGDTVKEEVEKLFGPLRYTIGGFREETYENEKVNVHYHASFGYLSITVTPK